MVLLIVFLPMLLVPVSSEQSLNTRLYQLVTQGGAEYELGLIVLAGGALEPSVKTWTGVWAREKERTNAA